MGAECPNCSAEMIHDELDKVVRCPACRLRVTKLELLQMRSSRAHATPVYDIDVLGKFANGMPAVKVAEKHLCDTDVVVGGNPPTER